MPPKKPPKKSKEDIEAEKKKKEDEERLAKELEEKRLEEERLRKELEAKRLQEQQVAFRQAELERLTAEAEAHVYIQENRRSAREHEEQKEARDLTWKKYLVCDPRPDATSLIDVNTFLSLLKEERVTDLSEAFKSVAYIDSIACSLQRVASQAHAVGDQVTVYTYQRLLTRLWESCVEKVDSATAHVLQYADELEETKGGEVIVVKREDRFRLGLWVNREVRAKKKLVDFGEAAMSIDVPKQLGQAFVACRNLYLPFPKEVIRGASSGNPTPGGSSSGNPSGGEPELGDLNGVFGRSLVLGGIYMLDMLCIPPLPKKIKGWVLRADTSLAQDIQRVPYPIGHLENAPLAALAAAPPIRCTFEVPAGVVLPAEPRVGWWDASKREWSDEFITEQDYFLDKRAMRFQTLKAGIFALLQPITEDLPYRSWSLEPVYDVPLEPGMEPAPQCHFTITTPRFTVRILIKDHRCRLLEPDLPDLSHLIKSEEDWGAGELLHALSRAGIHLMPNDEAARAPMTPKERELEAHFCREVASVAASFDFRSSRHNAPLGAARSVFHIRESSAFIGHNREVLNYSTLLLERDDVSESASNAPDVGSLGASGYKMAVIKTPSPNDEDDASAGPDLSILDNASTHVHLLPLLKESPMLATEEAMERVADSSTRHENTLTQLLRLTRVISFC